MNSSYNSSILRGLIWLSALFTNGGIISFSNHQVAKTLAVMNTDGDLADAQWGVDLSQMFAHVATAIVIFNIVCAIIAFYFIHIKTGNKSFKWLIPLALALAPIAGFSCFYLFFGSLFVFISPISVLAMYFLAYSYNRSVSRTVQGRV